MILRDIFKKQINEGGNLASHTAAGAPTVGWTGVPGTYSAGKIDSANRAAMQPAVKQLLVDINNLFTRQYGRPIWSPELIEKEVETFISGSSKWFMQLRQPNPNFNPQQPVSDANPKEIGVADKDFQRVKKKVGDIDTQIDRRLEPQIEEFIHKNIGANIGSATLLGTKKGSDQWLALWQLHEPPITLQVDLEFSDYTTDARGFEIPTEWAQVSHGSAWEDLEAGMKGVFRQWLYRSLAKVAPTDKYIAKLSGAGKKRGVRLFGGDDGKEPVVDLDNPPPPFYDANFSFAVASVGGGGVRAKYRQPTPEENVPLEINGVPVMVPLDPKDSEYIKDMSQQFEQFFGVPADGNQTKMMASFVGSVELMKQYFTPEQHQIVVNEFLKINFGKGAQMIDADDPTADFKTKMVAIDYLLDQTGMKGMRKQVLQMAKDYESAFNDKQPPKPLAEAEVKAQLRKGMPHLRDLKAPDFLDLLDEISDGNGRFKLQNIPLNVKVDGFGGRFGKNSDGKPFMGTSRTEPRYQAGFLAYHKQKGTTDPDVLGRAQLFDQLFNEMMNAVQLVDSKLGPGFLVNKQVTCEVLYLPFATETPEGKLKFVGIQYDKLPEGVQLALVPFRVTDADTGEDLEDSNKFIKQLLSVGSSSSVMFIDNSLTQKEGLDVTEIINPLDNIDQLKQIVSDTSGKRDRISQQLKREVEEKLQPIKLSLEKAIIEDPNIIGKDILGQDYEGIVINSRLGPVKVTSAEQKQVIADKNAAKSAARTEQPRGESKTAVVAIGSFVGHKGHQDLFKYTIDKAKELGGDPYLFIGNAEGKDDPIPPAVKVQTWHKLYPEYANNISTVQAGGQLIQKVKHELINPLPGKPPRYDNVVIMVGEDRAGLTMPAALMKAVNKFPGYEHVKVSLGITPRESGFSGTALRNSLKNDSPEKALAVWSKAFDVEKLGKDWILHLMDITKKGMGIAQQPAVEPAPVVAERLSTALIRPRTNEAAFKKSPYGRTAASQQRAKELLNPPKPQEPKKDEKTDEEWSQKYKSSINCSHPKGFSQKAHCAGKKKHDESVETEMTCPDCGMCEAHGNSKIYNKCWTGFRKVPGKSRGEDGSCKKIGEGDDPWGDQGNFAGDKPVNIGGSFTRPKLEAGSLVRVNAGHFKGIGEIEEIKGDQARVWINSYARSLVVDLKDLVPYTKNEGVAGAIVGGAAGAYLGKNARSAIAGADLGSEIQDKFTTQKNKGMAEAESNAIANAASRLANKDDGKVAKLRAAGDKRREDQLKGRDIAKRDTTSKDNWGNLKEKIKGADGKACWDGYRYNGTENGKDKCVEVNEDVQNIMDALINKIIVNEAIQNKNR